jgi:hypothetical protein
MAPITINGTLPDATEETQDGPPDRYAAVCLGRPKNKT